MHPFFFGHPHRPLFGLYHPAARATADRAALIVPPMGHEYLPAYPALQQLARRLARAGVHVLRFDLSGSGDSALETGAGDIPTWQEDLRLAAEELRAMAQIRTLTAIGLRLGASLLPLTELEADREVLWAPVARGPAYLAELRRLEAAYAESTLPRPRRAVHAGPAFEVLGYPISASLAWSLEAVDLTRAEAPPKPRLLIDRASTLLGALGEQASFHEYREARIWLKNESMDDAVVPSHTLDTIVEWTTA